MMRIGPHKGGVRIDMDADEAHEMACYYYRLSVESNPADTAKGEMLAIIRLAHSQDPDSCNEHDCPEPLEATR